MTRCQTRLSAFRPGTIALSQLLLFALLAHCAFATPPVLTSAVSRLTHGAAGAFDIQLPLSGATGVECRSVFNGATIVLTFDQPVTGGTAGSSIGAATVQGFNGNEMTVTLAGVTDVQTVALTVSDVTNAASETLASAVVNFRTLLGDVNSNGSVSGADVNICSAQSGKPVTGANFRCDIGTVSAAPNGAISAADINTIKLKVGNSTGGGKTANSPPTISNITDQNTASDTATPPVGFAIGDAESAVGTLAVSATSSDQTIVPNANIAIGGAGASRTISVTPAAGQTGNVVITVTVSDGLAYTIDTFVLSVGSPTKLYLATLRPAAGNVTSASGTSSLLLSGDETQASIHYFHANLAAAKTALEIRGPADAGQQGALLVSIPVTLQNEGDYEWTLVDVGSTTVAQIVEAIKAGQIYFSVGTSKYPSPASEIRGQYAYATGSQTFTPPPPPPSLPAGPSSPQEAQRFLTQATFGPNLTEITSIQGQTYDAWLNAQFATPTTSMYQMVYNRCTNSSAAGDALAGARITECWWRLALTAPDQLRQRIAFAYGEIFVVSRVEDAIDGQTAGLATYHDMLADDAFVNFRKLLGDVTLHPIMGQYLNMRGNKKQTSPTGPAPNENYAREVLQLFSIGLNALHPDGTLKLGADGLPKPTYAQAEIQAFAQVFTGWDTDPTPVNIPTLTTGNVVVIVPSFYNKPMTVKSSNHATVPKVLLNGFTIPENLSQSTISSNAELELALDNIFFHPNVGPFMARRLIQRLVTSNPSPAYIYRVASVFNDDGTGVRGNMQAVIRAILTDYEARSADFQGNQGYGKLREPLLRNSAIIRAFHPSSTLNSPPFGNIWKISNTDAELAQTPYRSPTVFNFYEPDYIPNGTGGQAGLYLPEMQIMTETTSISSANYFSTGISGTWNGGDVKINLDANGGTERDMTVTALMDELNLLLMGNQMPSNMRTTITTYLNTLASTTNAEKLTRARRGVYLVGSSTQFNSQK